MPPRLIVTSSRHVNARVRSLVKELARVIPGAIKLNRGKLSIEELFSLAKGLGAKRVVIVCRGLMGNPGRIIFLDTSEEEVSFYPLILRILGVKLAREHGVKATRPRGLVVVPGNLDDEVVQLSQELASVLCLNCIELPLEELSSIQAHYGGALLVERRGGKAFVLRFINTSDLKPIGPRLTVGNVVYRRLRYEEVVTRTGTDRKGD